MVAGAAVAVLIASACAAYSPAAAPATQGTHGSAAVLSTANGADGSYLVGPSGRAVYLWMADTSSTSNCSGPCAAAWPPVTTSGSPTTSGAAIAGEVGTTTRSDGAVQATYHGHPLYFYSGDSGAGQTNGQSLNEFGGQWWLVAPAGAALTAAASAAPSSPRPYSAY
jgi:predicted lipoprotein with Yx(FWY)xxD motif